MQITVYKHEGNYNGKTCYVHARAGALSDEHLLITTQQLNTSGCDAFGPIELIHTYDGGKSVTKPAPDPAFSRRELCPGVDVVECDGTPMLCKRTGKLVVMGHNAYYRHESIHEAAGGFVNNGYYAVYDEEKQAFSRVRPLPFATDEKYTLRAPGCSQFYELDTGELLIPITMCENGQPYVVSVFLCDFDGERITPKAQGNVLSYPVERGAYEPSVTYANGKFILTVRNDTVGLFATSEDGLHYTELAPWRFDDGSVLENYNTQQHLLLLGGAVYLVYTRRGANNDHVFRHRAPLFIARIDTERMCLVRESERIAVPERGARLGNFGVTNVSDTLAYITVTEWMQPVGCEKYGSNNALYIVKLEEDAK